MRYTHEVHAREVHAYEVLAREMHAHEMYAREMHAHEVHAYEVLAREMHAHEMYAREMHAHEVHAYEVLAREMHAHEMYAREMHAHEVHACGTHAHEVYPHEMHACITMRRTPMRYTPVIVIRLVLNPEQVQIYKNVVFTANAGFEMSAPIGIGVKISGGGDVSFNNRTHLYDLPVRRARPRHLRPIQAAQCNSGTAPRSIPAV